MWLQGLGIVYGTAVVFLFCFYICYFSLLDGHPYLSVNVSCSVIYGSMFHVLFVCVNFSCWFFSD